MAWLSGTTFTAHPTDPSSRSVLALRVLGPVPPSALDPELRLGRALFHDATNPRSTLRRMACANCHPDGREDGLVWEHKATFRQTPMLAGGRLHDTAPFNWLGSAPTLEANIQNTVRTRLGGDGLLPNELAALARYLREGLRPVTRPASPPAPLVDQGRQLFESADTGCSTCHPADFSFTDGAVHDVHSVGAAERRAFAEVNGEPDVLSTFSQRFQRKTGHVWPRLPRRFNTPSLAFVGLTAPYLHDGSAESLDQLIARNADRMGTTTQLTAEQRRALVAYLESL